MNAPRVFTIGYERATVDGVIAALTAAGIALLVDVRALPLSRRPGFSKTALAGAVGQAGIAYRHMKALGTPKEGRDAARRGDHATMARLYAGQLGLPEAMAAAAELEDLARQRPVALLCYERDPCECHRSLLVEAALANFEAVDLYPVDLSTA